MPPGNAREAGGAIGTHAMDTERTAGRKPVYLFLLQALLVYLVFYLGPSAKSYYPPLFHAEANAVFRALGEGRVVRLRTPVQRNDLSDTEMLGYVKGRFEPRFTARFQIHERGYWPLVAVLSMLLVTPLPWRRRLLGMAVGALLANAFTLVQVAAVALAYFGAGAAGVDDPVSKRTLAAAEGMFNSEIPRVLAVMVIWSIVARPAQTIDAASLKAWLAGVRERR